MPQLEYSKWTAKDLYVRGDRTPVRPHSQRYRHRTKMPKGTLNRALQGKALSKADNQAILENSGSADEYSRVLEDYENIRTGNKEIRSDRPLEMSPAERMELNKEVRKYYKKKIKKEAQQSKSKSEFIQKSKKAISGHFVVVKRGNKYYVYEINSKGEEVPISGRRSLGFTSEQKAWNRAFSTAGVRPSKTWDKYGERKLKPAKPLTEYQQIGKRDKKPKGRHGVRWIKNQKKNTVMMYPERPFTQEIRENMDKMGWHKSEGGYYQIKSKDMPEGSYEYEWFVSEVLEAKPNTKTTKYRDEEERLSLAKAGKPVKMPKTKRKVPKYVAKKIRTRKLKKINHRFYYFETKSKAKSNRKPKKMKKALVNKGLDTGDWSGYYKVVRVRQSSMPQQEKDVISGKGETIYQRKK